MTLDKPAWYAVVSATDPSIDTTRKTQAEALELAGKLRERWPDVQVVALYSGARAEDGMPAAPAAAPATGWTGNADADLALILLDRLDDTGEGNAIRIEQLEGLVRKLAAAQDLQIKALRPLPFSNAEIDRLYANIPPTAQQDARSREAFRRIVRVVEAGHDIRAAALQAPAAAPGGGLNPIPCRRT